MVSRSHSRPALWVAAAAALPADAIFWHFDVKMLLRTTGGILLAWLPGLALHAQTSGHGTTFQVQVNEVTLPFRAYDDVGRPVVDLRLPELLLRDNRKAPGKILSFTHLTDQPIRIGFLLDVSPSIEWSSLIRGQDTASLFATEFLRPRSDKAFVMKFDFDQKFLSGWSDNPPDLQEAISSIGDDRRSRMGGTAIYDALYRGVRDEIARQTTPGQNSNAVVVFTDGDDNASHARLSDVIDICERTNTAIYLFSSNTESRFDTGEKNLRELAAESGGRVFFDEDPAGIRDDLRTVEEDLRSYYLIVYRPAKLKPNGAFHHIQLETLRRNVEIDARAGYYAPQPSH